MEVHRGVGRAIRRRRGDRQDNRGGAQVKLKDGAKVKLALKAVSWHWTWWQKRRVRKQAEKEAREKGSE